MFILNAIGSIAGLLGTLSMADTGIAANQAAQASQTLTGVGDPNSTLTSSYSNAASGGLARTLIPSHNQTLRDDLKDLAASQELAKPIATA